MNKRVNYCFHSHTYRCGHAKGDIEDYVKKVIEKGYKYYGVSDHVFLPGISQKGTRGDYELLDDYINTFQKVSEKYKKQIRMFLAFECEYAKVFEDYYRYLLKEKKFDYLICGQHLCIEDDKSIWWYLDGSVKGFMRYKDDVIDAIKSGLFLYIAHPDLFFLRVSEITPLIAQITDEIIDTAIKFDVPLELNIHGLYRKERETRNGFISYPAEYFWQRAAIKRAKVVIGGDFHDPFEIDNVEMPSQAYATVKKYNLKLVPVRKLLSRIKKGNRK